MFRNSLNLLVSLSLLVACGPADNDVTVGGGGAGAGANNSAPDAGNPFVETIDEDTTSSVNVVTQATDEEGDDLIFTITTQATNGDAVFDDVTGEITYTPNQDFNGDDLIIYSVADSFRESFNTIDITVDPVNDAPVADDILVDDVLEDSAAVTIDLGELSSDVDGDELTLDSLAVDAEYGTVVIDTVNFTAGYTPNPDYFGTDSFEYQISDTTGTTATGIVSLDIIGQNDAPVANAAEENIDEDSVDQTLDLANFSEHADPVTLTYTIDAGSLDAVINGSVITFSPDANFNGDATFTYTVADEDAIPETASNSVTFHVAPVNDDPIANNSSLVLDEDTVSDIDLATLISDIDGDNLSISFVSNPGNGSLINNGTVYEYTPNNNFYGSDSFAYEVSDGFGGEAEGLISITVNSINDDPTASNSTATCDEDSSVSTDVVALGSDIDLADSLSLSSVSTATSGVVAINGDLAVYTPNADFFGIDTYTFTLEDEEGATATATITVTVDPVNDDPVAVDGSAGCDEDESVSTDVIADLCSDVDTSDVLSIASTTNGNNGSCVIAGDSIVYTPNADFNGVDTYSFTVSDGNNASDTASVTVTVTPINDDPVAAGTSDTCDEDSSVTTILIGFNSDVDGDVLSLDSVGNPINGAVTKGVDNATFTPDPDFNGAASYEYTITDGFGGYDTGTVTITVNNVNDAPVATSDSFEVLENTQSATLDVLSNDIDVDGDNLSVIAIDDTLITNGSLTLNAGLIAFTPDADYFGTAGTFTYTINDGTVSHTATSSIEVTEENAFADSLAYELSGVSTQPQGFYSQVRESGSAFLLDIPGNHPLLTNVNGQGDILFSATVNSILPNSSYALASAALSTADDNSVMLAMNFDNGNIKVSTCMSFDATGTLLWSKAVRISGGGYSVSAVAGLANGGALLAVYSNFADTTIMLVLDNSGNEQEELTYDLGSHVINAIVPYTGNYYMALSDSGILVVEDDGDGVFHYGGAVGASINIASARVTADGILMSGSDQSGATLGAYSSLYDPGMVINPVLWSNTLADPLAQLDIEHNDLVLDSAGNFVSAGSINNIAGGTVVPTLHRLDSAGASVSLSSFAAFVDGRFDGLIPNQTAANVVGSYNAGTDFSFFTMSFDAADAVVSSCSTFGSAANLNFVSAPGTDVGMNLTKTNTTTSDSDNVSIHANTPIITLQPSVVSREALCL